LDKQQALFYSNLGLVLKELKQYEEAKRAHQQSVDLNPASAINRRYLANILKTIGKLDQAEEQIYKAYELDKTDTNSLILMAQIAQAKKRPLEALNTVSQAITLAPNSLPAQNLLGLILMENGQTEKALKIFDQIVNISPLEAGFRLNRGNALRDLHRLKEAALAFRQCLKLNIHMTGAFYGLSQVEAIRPADELVQKMQKMLRQEGLGHTLKESILYALGIALENEEKYSQALECWDQANKLRQSRTRFDIRQEKAKWNRIQRFFPTAQHHERTVKLQPEAQTLFVVGMPCTGKRLIETILASNQDIARLGDSELIHSLAVNTPKHHGLKKSFPFYLSEIDQETLLSIGNEYVQGAKYITKENFHCFVNRQFHNAYYIGFIRKILPNAKVIYCYRNLKDVCFSSYTQKFQNTFSFPCKLRDIITMYHLYEQTIRFWKNIFPDMILEVSFEQIITHPTSVIKELLEYCELPVNWRVTHQKLIAVQKQISKDQGFFCLGPHAPIGRWERFSSLLSPESFQNPN
jgi:Flp pilus assembly protein TadD